MKQYSFFGYDFYIHLNQYDSKYQIGVMPGLKAFDQNELGRYKNAVGAIYNVLIDLNWELSQKTDFRGSE